MIDLLSMHGKINLYKVKIDCDVEILPLEQLNLIYSKKINYPYICKISALAAAMFSLNHLVLPVGGAFGKKQGPKILSLKITLATNGKHLSLLLPAYTQLQAFYLNIFCS